MTTFFKQISKKAALTLALLAATAQVQASAVNIDGVLTAPDEYDAVFDLIMEIENRTPGGKHLDVLPGEGFYTGQLRLSWGTEPGSVGDLFMMFMMPTGIQDFTYGDNQSEGYRVESEGQYKKVQGSEHFFFEFLGETIKVGMDDNTDSGTRNGHTIKNDSNNLVKDVSTSLTRNMENYLGSNPEYFDDGANSPGCGTAAVQGSGTATWEEKDQDCYTNPTDAPLWEYQHIYELQLDGQFFDDEGITELIDIPSLMAGINVHASDPKRGGEHGFIIRCLEGDQITCTPSETPEPATLLLISTGIMGLLYGHRRRRNSTA